VFSGWRRLSLLRKVERRALGLRLTQWFLGKTLLMEGWCVFFCDATFHHGINMQPLWGRDAYGCLLG